MSSCPGIRLFPSGNAQGLGGGILNLGTVKLNDTRIIDNVAGNGGGIYQIADHGINASTFMTNSVMNNPNGGFDLVSISPFNTGEA